MRACRLHVPNASASLRRVVSAPFLSQSYTHSAASRGKRPENPVGALYQNRRVLTDSGRTGWTGRSTAVGKGYGEYLGYLGGLGFKELGTPRGASSRPWPDLARHYSTRRLSGGLNHDGYIQKSGVEGSRTSSLTARDESSFARTSNGVVGDSSGHLGAEEAIEDTIYALSTAPGKAAIAVIRISGPACTAIYQSLCPNKALPRPRFAAVRTLYEPSAQWKPADLSKNAEVLDSNSLVLYFPGPHSVTGEDILELHVHGGPAIIKAVLKAIPACGTAASKIRYAEAGEFTRRAFLNDRLDLTQAEALGNALDAVTEQQRRQSVRGTAGRLAKQYEDWRGLLLYARGELEALIDFSEDQHFDESPAMLAASVATQVRGLRARIAVYVENAVRGELLRSGISVALLGQPNAGKSSLLNLIVGREAAIVSREAGTTRDVVEVSVDLGGYLCRFSDTAGLRSATTALNGGHTESSIQPIGLVEKEGIARAKRRALESDVVIVLLSHEHDSNGTVHLNIDHDVLETAHQCAEQGAQVIIAVNKSDLAPIAESDPTATDAVRPAVERLQRSLTQGSGSVPLLWISCRQAGDPTLPHSGIKPLLNALISTFEQMTSALRPDTAQDGADQLSLIDNSLWQDSLGASERQRLLLEECAAQLDSFLAQVSNASGNDMDIVIAAESLRAAAECLARITGRGDAGDVEEVLGVVFEKFCVGK